MRASDGFQIDFCTVQIPVDSFNETSLHNRYGVGLASRLPWLPTGAAPLDEPGVCIADGTRQMGCKKARIVLRVPVSACSQGTTLTLQQVEVMGLSLGETWHGPRVNTALLALFERCGWHAYVVRDCGSAIKQGIGET